MKKDLKTLKMVSYSPENGVNIDSGCLIEIDVNDMKRVITIVEDRVCEITMNDDYKFYSRVENQ
jgi:hypothetical protein